MAHKTYEYREFPSTVYYHREGNGVPQNHVVHTEEERDRYLNDGWTTEAVPEGQEVKPNISEASVALAPEGI